MRNLRKAIVVATMAGAMGMFGAGVAAAHGEDKKHDNGSFDFVVNNPQFLNCEYSDNTSTLLSQVSTAGTGDATNTATLGNVCVQTAPTFED